MIFTINHKSYNSDDVRSIQESMKTVDDGMCYYSILVEYMDGTFEAIQFDTEEELHRRHRRLLEKLNAVSI